MAVMAIAAIGSGIGGAIGGTFLGVAASSWGYMIGSIVGSMLFGPEGEDQKGPRLKDSTYTGEVEGTDMPILWGGDRLPGKPIWIKTPPREIKKKEDVGGKGGGGGSVTSYSYFQDFAICFGGFISQPPRRIWMNQEIVYDASGANAEVKISGLTFSWYRGDTGEIDSLIEQTVGAGNCPAYSGRCVMVITGLDLTTKFGNRIPVIEAEIQTTGAASTTLTSWNMGDSGYPAEFYGMDQVIRHPTDNTFISMPLVNSVYYGQPLFFTDMVSQYSYRWWNEATWANGSLTWFYDPWPDTLDQITHVLYTQTCPGCSYSNVWKIAYPSGKTEGFASYSIGSGGGSMVGTSKFKNLICMRNAGSSLAFIDNQTLAMETIHNINTLLGSTGINVQTFYQGGATCIDLYNSIFGSFRDGLTVATNGVKSGYFITDYNWLDITLPYPTPTVTHKSNPFETIGPLDVDPFQFNVGDLSFPIYVEETGEIWVGYLYPGTVYDKASERRIGIMALDAESGDLNYFIDFVEAGFTTASAYWGSLSGYPTIHWDPEQRRIWWALSGTAWVGNINVDTRNIQDVGYAGTGNAWAISYANRNSIWGAVETTNDYIIQERKLAIVAQGTVAISTIIADICKRCGLASNEYDVSALTSKTIGSFIHGTRHSGRQDIELLLGIAQADAVQSDNKMKFILRGGTVAVTIPNDDLGAHEVQSLPEVKDPVSITLPQETEIPQVLEIQYRSRENNYNQGIAQSFIATGANIAKKTAQLPVSLSNQQASDLAETYHQQLVDPVPFSFDLPIRYTFLEPTDVVEVPKNGKNYRVRITKTARGVNWIMQCQGIIDRAENQVSTAVAPGVDDFLGTITTQQFPQGFILDTPLMRDADLDQPGPYLTSFVYTETFPPSLWYYSVDDSVFNEINSQTEQPFFGIVDTAVNASIWEDWSTSVIRVKVLNGVTLSSSTKAAILADPTINAFAYGRQGRWELFNAATVTQVTADPLVYDLTDLLKGRRGTDNYIQAHQSKDYLVGLSSAGGMFRQTLQNSQIGNVFFYRLPTDGVAVSDVNSFQFTMAGTPLKPYSPIQVESVGYDASAWAASTVYALNAQVKGSVKDSRVYICTTAGTSGGTEPTWNTTIGGTTTDNTATWTAFHEYDLDLTWTRRTRRGGSLGGDNTLTDGVGGPLEEDSKEYEVDVVKVSDGSVIATKSGLTTESLEYLGADQVTDGVPATAGSFYLDTYQLSAAVGRGFRGRVKHDRGLGAILSYAVDLGVHRLFTLNDAAGANAFEWMTQNATAGTYTSAAAEKSVNPDNFASLKCDGTGYMKCGTTLRDAITSIQQGTIVIFQDAGGVSFGKREVSATHGGSSEVFYMEHRGSYKYFLFRPKVSGSAIGLNGSSTSEEINSRVCMTSWKFDLNGTFQIIHAINGIYNNQVTYGTGHSGYASYIQHQTRDANYNDTISGSTALAPANIVDAGSVAYVMIFRKHVSDTDLRNMFLAALAPYGELMREQASLSTHNKLSIASLSPANFPADFGASSFLLKNLNGKKRSITPGSEWGTSQGTNGYLYSEADVSEYFVDTFTVEFWVELTASPTGWNYLLSFEPIGWNQSVKKGFHLAAHNTTGLTCLLGEGGAGWTQVDNAIANMVTGNIYHVACSIHPTNGIKLYLDGTEIANNSGTAISPDWVDATTGNLYPPTACAYLNGYNNSSAANGSQVTTFGIAGRYNDFAFFTEELSAATILEHYNRGKGIVV